MIKSMTGFGRCEVADEKRKFTVELKSVNHRYLDVNIKMPKKLNFFESAIRNLLKEYIERGKVDVYITYAAYFCGLLVSKIKNVISAYMIRRKISFLEVTGYLDEISEDCKNAVKDEFERFGAEVINFYVETIIPPKSDYEKLREYKEKCLMGKLE